MPEETINNSSHKKLVGGVLVCVLALTGVYYAWTKILIPVLPKQGGEVIDMYILQTKKNEAKSLLDNGDYMGAQKAYEKLLTLPMSAEDFGRTTILYSAALYKNANEKDSIRAIALLEDISGATKYSGEVRVLAINTLAGMVARNIDRNQYAAYFRKEPFVHFLPASSTSEQVDISTAYRKMLEYSESVMPNSYAELVLAGDYYGPIVVASLTKNPPEMMQAETAAKKIQEYVKLASQKHDQNIYAKDVLLWMQFNKAVALTSSNRVLKNVPLSDREEAFASVVAMGNDAAYSGAGYQTTIMRARFLYANLIREVYGVKKKQEIADLLLPYGAFATSTNDVATQMRKIFSGHAKNPNSPIAQFALALAPFSQPFAVFLKNTGFAIK